MPKLASLSDCTGCNLCVDSCPTGAIMSIIDIEGHISYTINNDKCIECGKCERSCPVVTHYSYGTNELDKSFVYAACSKDTLTRKNSASGGVFAELAKAILQRGGIVIGASMECNKVKHIEIDRVEDIPKLQGSKYTQSSTSGIFNIVKSHLLNGRLVLFSGLGCQVAALLKYVDKLESKENLFTVDLICGGVPSSFLISKYMEANSETVNSIFSFRTKMKYELTVMDKEDRKKVVPLSFKPLPICGFYTELTHRYSCYDCRYAFAHRNSDITIGDMWGAEHIPELSIQFKDGLNVVVAHSTKGVDLLKSSDVEFRETDWKFLLHNPRMVYGHSELKNSRNRQILAYAFANYTYPELQEMYANYATIRKPVLMLKKVFRFIQAKQRRKKAVKYVLSLINKS